MVPHLETALTGPINALERAMLEAMPAIERWFRLEWMEHTPPFYSSVDVRNAGYKLAPVDTSLFPTCFHHLSEQTRPLAVQAAMAAIEKICPEARRLLLISKTHASKDYLLHLGELVRIFERAGMQLRLGMLDIDTAIKRRLPDGTVLEFEPVKRERRRVGLQGFDPCTVLLNDNLCDGVPRTIDHLPEQFVLPPLQAGWQTRRMHRHFKHYDDVAKRFAKMLGIDPWLIAPLTVHGGTVTLTAAHGLEELRGKVNDLLAKLTRKHKDYRIKAKPFVVIKANDASPDLGIITLDDASQLRTPKRLLQHGSAARVPMTVDVLVQEGVATREHLRGSAAEPVVYMIDRYVIGGFYRLHAQRSEQESLSAPGAAYVPLAFANAHELPQMGKKPGQHAPNRFYMYGVVARLAMLAAAYELEATDPEAAMLAA